MFEVFPLRFEPKLWPQRTQREGGGTYCSYIECRTDIDCRRRGRRVEEGIGPPAHRLFRTSDLRYLA